MYWLVVEQGQAHSGKGVPLDLPQMLNAGLAMVTKSS